jgi:hypothetical protein
VSATLVSLFALAGLRAGREPTAALATMAALSFVSGLTFTLLPAMLSPRPWPVALGMFGLAVLMDAAQIGSMAMYPYQRYRIPLAASILGLEAAGGLLALLLVRRLARPAAPPAPLAQAGTR